MILARSFAVTKSALTVAAISVSQTVYGIGKNDHCPTNADSRCVFDSSELLQNSEVSVIDEKSPSTNANDDDKAFKDSDSLLSLIDSRIEYDCFGDLSTFDFVKISKEEAESAIEVVKDMPAVHSILRTIPEESARDLFNRTVEMVRNPDYLHEIKKKMESKMKEKAIDQHQLHEHVDLSGDKEDVLAKWDVLVDNHRCAICQDLLAGPMLLKCTHSFCFHCLHEYVNRCQLSEDNLSNKTEVVHKCPLCPQEFQLVDAIFERTMDHNIAEQAYSFPESLGKDWMERRHTWLEYQKQQTEAVTRSNEERYLAQMKEEETQKLRQQLNEWTDFCNSCVPYLAFLVLVVVSVYHRNKT